jgi:tRNA(Arg) A34 adenosine deaminase TadA
MSNSPTHPAVHVEYPVWIDQVVDWNRAYTSDEDRMRLAIAISRANVEHGAAPFGAAIYEEGSGRLASVGRDCSLEYNNCALHGEMMAFMMAQQKVRSHTLHAPNLPAYDLFTSCEPCAMCLGATLWSGVRRVACAAAREDAEGIGFDEGPVFRESYLYLESRGISFTKGLLRDEAREVLQMYRERGGKGY